MRELFCGVLAGALCLAPACGAQESKSAGRAELLNRLNEDIGKAMANAKLKDDETNKLTNARQVIGGFAASRRSPGRAEREKLAAALDDVKSVFKSKAIGKDEKKLVENDLKKVKELRLTETAGNRDRDRNAGRGTGGAGGMRDPTLRRDPGLGRVGGGGQRRR